MKKIIILCLLFCSVGSLSAQPLTLEECRAMAVKNSLRLLSSQQMIEKSNDMVKAYKSNSLPRLSLNGDYLYSSMSFTETLTGGYLPTFVPDPSTGQLTPNIVGAAPDGTPIFGSYAYMPDQEFEVEVGSAFNLNLMLAQPIYLGGKISSAVKLAKVGVEVAELNRTKTKAEIIVETDEAFYAFLKVGELLKSAEDYYAVVEEFSRQVSNGYKEGMTTKNDAQRVGVQLNDAKLSLLKCQNGLRLARMNLCYVLGMPLTTQELSVVDDFDMTVEVDSENFDISNRPEYQMLEKQIEAKKLETKLVRSEFLPSVTAMATYGYTNGATINDKPLFNDDGFTAGVRVSVPLFHWGEGRRKISAGKREEQMARYQMEDLSQKMRLEVMQAANRYEEASLEVELCDESRVQAAENMRMAEGKYKEGMETLGDYLESQALWQKSMSDLVEANASLRLAYSSYLKSVGELR